MISSSWISWSMFYAAWYPITMPAFAVFLCGKSMNYRNVHVNKVIYKWVALSFNSKIGNCRLGYREYQSMIPSRNNKKIFIHHWKFCFSSPSIWKFVMCSVLSDVDFLYGSYVSFLFCCCCCRKLSFIFFLFAFCQFQSVTIIFS